MKTKALFSASLDLQFDFKGATHNSYTYSHCTYMHNAVVGRVKYIQQHLMIKMQQTSAKDKLDTCQGNQQAL